MLLPYKRRMTGFDNAAVDADEQMRLLRSLPPFLPSCGRTAMEHHISEERGPRAVAIKADACVAQGFGADRRPQSFFCAHWVNCRRRFTIPQLWRLPAKKTGRWKGERGLSAIYRSIVHGLQI
jgi:hypothetical protein